MRIAITDFHQDWGGQAYQVLLLAQALRERGHEVCVICPPGSDLEQRARAASLPTLACRFRRGFRPWSLLRDILALRRCFRERNIEVVHCHGSQDSWHCALATSLLRGAPALVRSKHNSYRVAGHVFNRWLYGRAFKRVVAVAETIRQDLLRARVVAPARTRTVHAGLPDGFGAGIDPDDARRSVHDEFEIPDHALVVGLVGRLEPAKGQEVLMRAMAKIRRGTEHVHALCIGTGGDYDRLLALRAELGLEYCVHFPLFREDVDRLTAALDAAVLAAYACDASSTVLKEAMILGVPVIGTRVGGTAEILEDGACGVLIPPGDIGALAGAVVSTLVARGTTDQAARLERARARVKSEYAMSAVARKTEDVYAEALAER